MSSLQLLTALSIDHQVIAGQVTNGTHGGKIRISMSDNKVMMVDGTKRNVAIVVLDIVSLMNVVVTLDASR